jgi:hypothetical protein
VIITAADEHSKVQEQSGVARWEATDALELVADRRRCRPVDSVDNLPVIVGLEDRIA